MYVSWRKQQYLDDLKQAQEPCCCGNNEDLCEPCQARDAFRKGDYVDFQFPRPK